jgi:transcriptional regulator with XRE-family HTH domain
MTIGEKLRKLRLAKGIPAAALDERFDIQRGHWMNWENGYSTPEPELLDEIAEYFGVSVKELRNDE